MDLPKYAFVENISLNPIARTPANEKSFYKEYSYRNDSFDATYKTLKYIHSFSKKPLEKNLLIPKQNHLLLPQKRLYCN